MTGPAQSSSSLGDVPQKGAVMPNSPVALKREAETDDETVSTTPSSQKKKPRRTKTEKGNKGLRHFSMKVCQKVQEKNVTTYNEVADELVHDITSAGEGGGEFDQKNIRRRVYDALNVLMAMDIISKYKKEIRWIGLPTNSQQELESLQAERLKLRERLAKKKAHLQELVLQQIAVQNLVKRNEENEELTSQYRIQLPFIIVNTDKQTHIECEMAEDRTKYFFNFNMPFEIHDDLEILKRMGLTAGLEKQSCTPEELEAAKTLLPPALVPYLEDMALGRRDQNGS